MATMTALSSGEITYPLQPSFLALLAAAVNDVTGDGTVYTIAFDTEVFDQNGDFNGTTTFTAPVTGRYRFRTQAYVAGLTTSYTSGNSIISTSNRDFICRRINPGAVKQQAAQTAAFPGAVLCDMDSGDTAVLKVVVSGSNKTIDMNASSATSVRNYFSGSLIA